MKKVKIHEQLATSGMGVKGALGLGVAEVSHQSKYVTQSSCPDLHWREHFHKNGPVNYPILITTPEKP